MEILQQLNDLKSLADVMKDQYVKNNQAIQNIETQVTSQQMKLEKKESYLKVLQSKHQMVNLLSGIFKEDYGNIENFTTLIEFSAKSLQKYH